MNQKTENIKNNKELRIQDEWEKNLLSNVQIRPFFPQGRRGFIPKRKWKNLLKKILSNNPDYILIWKAGGKEESWRTLFKIIPKEDFPNMQMEGWNKAYSYMKDIGLE